MRRVLWMLLLLAGPLIADQVVLRDGRVLETKKPPTIRGRQAVLVLADGKLVSIPATELDMKKTAALAAKPTVTGSGGKTAESPPPTLVDAARASAAARKAVVILTDRDVAGGRLEPTGEKSISPGRVVVSNVSARKAGGGTAVTGSVQNAGEVPIEGVAVTVEAVGADGKTIASAFGQLSADALGAGEKATFSAQLDAEAGAQNVRVVPRWRETKRAAAGADASGQAGRSEAPGESPAGVEPPPTPVPAPTATPTPPSRPSDVAAPPANAPVGAPASPGGTYLPLPASDQPKPPGGG